MTYYLDARAVETRWGQTCFTLHCATAAGKTEWKNEPVDQQWKGLIMPDLQALLDQIDRLAAAVKGVLDVLDTYPAPSKEADPTGYATARLAQLEHRIREAITDTMKADND